MRITGRPEIGRCPGGTCSNTELKKYGIEIFFNGSNGRTLNHQSFFRIPEKQNVRIATLIQYPLRVWDKRGATIPVNNRIQLYVLLFSLVLFIPVSGSGPEGDWSYSVVHISDTQVLSSSYPSTLNFTFSYLESVRTAYNISGIVVTGDLVNSCTNSTQWERYAAARSRTVIPLYEVAGNHDVDGAQRNYTAFDAYIGSGKRNWTSEIGDFLWIGIGYTRNELGDAEVTTYNTLINSSPSKIPIFGTHNYFDGTTYPSSLSPLGESIRGRLVVRDPTFVMCGHMHGNILHSGRYSGKTLVEDMTNYQGYGDYSAGRMYTIYKIFDKVVRIGTRDLSVYPSQSLGTESIVYQIPFMAVVRPWASENWIFTDDLSGVIVRDHYGLASDVPLMADINNDGITDRVVFRSGEWIADYDMDGSVDLRDHYGAASDIPLIWDFDEDGIPDRAVFRNGQWIFDYGPDGDVDRRDLFGMPGDIPLVGDFDNEGTPDRAVFRASAWDNWIFDFGMNGTVDVREHFGMAGDTPLVGRFDTDLFTDRAVFRNGEWIIEPPCSPDNRFIIVEARRPVP